MRPAILAQPIAQRRTETLLWSGRPGQLVNAADFAWGLVLCWLLAPAAHAIGAGLRTACQRFELTDERLIEHAGVFARERRQLELVRVKDIRSRQSLLERLCRRETIVVDTSDADQPTVVLPCLPVADDVADLLRDAVEMRRQTKTLFLEPNPVN